MTSRFSSHSIVRPFVIGLFGALGVIVWGCGPGDEGRYYCDTGACYTCDAYGCSPTAAPTHPTCTGNATCGASGVCTTTGCTTSCTTDATCPKGETCQSNLCSPPGKAPGATTECTTTTDCGSGKTCASNKCIACGGTNGPCPCTAQTDCTGGLECVGGSCTAPSNACKFSSECADGKICADGQCLSSCATSQCDAAFTCTKGVCEPNPGNPGTVGGSDGGTSTGGQSCTTDATCGDGKFCDQGACVIDTRPKPNCAADNECGGTAATPKKCLDGFCKYSCTSDQYCRTIDNRIGYCAKDGVCRTSSEASAACTGPGQCPNNGACIDNVCK